MKRALLCWLTFGFTTCLQAQQPASKPPGPPELPPGPLIKPVPDRTSWLVTTVTKPAANPSPGPASTGAAGSEATPKPVKSSRSLGGQKIGTTMFVWMTTDNGKEERWSDGKTMVTTNAAWKVPLFSTGTPEEFPKPTWISRKNIKEIKKQGDHEFWIFRDRIFPGGEIITKEMLLPGESPESLKVDATAVIDADTRLPAGTQVGDETTTYKFEALPDGATLTLPPELSALLAKRQQLIESAVRKPVRP